jgi:hypothetical protein
MGFFNWIDRVFDEINDKPEGFGRYMIDTLSQKMIKRDARDESIVAENQEFMDT